MGSSLAKVWYQNPAERRPGSRYRVVEDGAVNNKVGLERRPVSIWRAS